MRLKEIHSIEEELQKSPIRKYLKNNNNAITLFENEKIRLEKLDEIIKSSIENLNNPLKAVVLGEVKAGKSTLINALIQKEVAYTNVVEATATILEISYAKDEKIIIEYKGGIKKQINSLRDLNKLMDLNRLNQEFFEDIKSIYISTPTKRLKEITIVDTPGLNTITSENAKRTEDYIKNSDVILWVLNAHNLGQTDVIEKIEEVMNFGKPIIGIVNRIDEVDGDKEDILGYVEEEMGYIFEEIFLTSAKRAWSKFLDKDEDTDCDIKELYDFIINNIESNSKKFQEESIEKSIITQVQRDCKIHINTKQRLEGILNKINDDFDDLDKFNMNIKSIIRNKMTGWIDVEFFENERIQLHSCESKEEFSKLLKQYKDKNYIQNIINNQYEKMGNYILNEWKNYSSSFINKKTEEIYCSIDIEDFDNSDEFQMTSHTSHSEVLEGAKQGGLTAGAIGLGLAGYAAWLGPAASYITIGSALGAFLPPLLIAGAIGGFTWNFLKKDTEKSKQYEKIDRLIRTLRAEAKKNILDEMISNLEKSSDHYYNYTSGIICEILNKCNTSKEEIEDIHKQLTVYIDYINDELSEYVFD